MTTEQFNQIKTGDAFWGYLNNKLHVFRKLQNGIFMADNWEGTVSHEIITFISIIQKP